MTKTSKKETESVPAAELGERAKKLVQDASHTANMAVQGVAQDVADKAHAILHDVAHDVAKVAKDVEKKNSDKKSGK